MNKDDFLVGIFEFREEIPDLLVSSCFLAERVKKPKKFENYGQEVMDIVKKPVNLRNIDQKRLEQLYWSYSNLYVKIAEELAYLCEVAENSVPRVILSPRLARWWNNYKYNGV